jgi:hypothetical protein
VTHAKGDAVDSYSAGASLTTIQAVFLGMMLAWTPSVVLLAFLLWREGTELLPG